MRLVRDLNVRRRGSEVGRVAWVVVGVVLVVVVVGLVAGGFAAQLWDNRTDPATVPLPDIKKANATERYMADEGLPLLPFLQATADLPNNPTVGSCRELVKTDLSKHPTPPELTARAQRIPDPTLSASFVNHISSVVDYLGACGAQADMQSEADNVRFTAVIAQRQLSRISP